MKQPDLACCISGNTKLDTAGIPDLQLSLLEGLLLWIFYQ